MARVTRNNDYDLTSPQRAQYIPQPNPDEYPRSTLDVLGDIAKVPLKAALTVLDTAERPLNVIRGMVINPIFGTGEFEAGTLKGLVPLGETLGLDVPRVDMRTALSGVLGENTEGFMASINDGDIVADAAALAADIVLDPLIWAKPLQLTKLGKVQKSLKEAVPAVLALKSKRANNVLSPLEETILKESEEKIFRATKEYGEDFIKNFNPDTVVPERFVAGIPFSDEGVKFSKQLIPDVLKPDLFRFLPKSQTQRVLHDLAKTSEHLRLAEDAKIADETRTQLQKLFGDNISAEQVEEFVKKAHDYKDIEFFNHLEREINNIDEVLAQTVWPPPQEYWSTKIDPAKLAPEQEAIRDIGRRLGLYVHWYDAPPWGIPVGLYHMGAKSVYLNAQNTNPGGALSTFLHELIHAVQDKQKRAIASDIITQIKPKFLDDIKTSIKNKGYTGEEKVFSMEIIPNLMNQFVNAAARGGKLEAARKVVYDFLGGFKNQEARANFVGSFYDWAKANNVSDNPIKLATSIADHLTELLTDITIAKPMFGKELDDQVRKMAATIPYFKKILEGKDLGQAVAGKTGLLRDFLMAKEAENEAILKSLPKEAKPVLEYMRSMGHRLLGDDIREITPAGRAWLRDNKIVMSGTIAEVNKRAQKRGFKGNLIEPDFFKAISSRSRLAAHNIYKTEYFDSLFNQFSEKIRPTRPGEHFSLVDYLAMTGRSDFSIGGQRIAWERGRNAKKNIKEALKPFGYDKIGIPTHIWKDAQIPFKTMETPEGLRGIMKTYDKVLNIWRGSVTANFPLFHMRNLFSSYWNSMLGGVGGYRDFKGGKRLLDVINLKEPPVPKGMTRLYRGEEKLTPQILAENARIDAEFGPGAAELRGRWYARSADYAEGYINPNLGGKRYYIDIPTKDVSSYQVTSLGEKTLEDTGEYLLPRHLINRKKYIHVPSRIDQKLIEEMVGMGIPLKGSFSQSMEMYDVGHDISLTGLTGKQSRIDEWFYDPKIAGHKVPLPGYKHGVYIENWARISHYIGRRRKGDTPVEAAASVRKYLFNYSELSPFEKAAMKRLAFFYTWTRKNTPLMFENIFSPPNLSAYKAMGIGGEEPKDQPQWIRDAGVFVLNKESNGRLKTLDLGLPPQDILGITGPGKLASLMSPLLRIPLEGIADVDFFTGRRLSEQDKASGILKYLKFLPGYRKSDTGYTRIDPRLNQIIKASPASRFINTPFEGENPAEMLFNLTAGKVRTIYPTRTPDALKQLIERRTFSGGLYKFPVYGATTPQDQKLAKYLNQR